MSSAPATAEIVRQHAERLLSSIGISRIVVVDDEYSGDRPEVEELIGICSVLPAAQAAELPYLDHIDFEADRAIWASGVRERWPDLEETAKLEVLEQARSREEKAAETEVSDPDASNTPDAAASAESVDTRVAKSLKEILDGLNQYKFVALSLKEWKKRSDELLADEAAASTVFLFDRDFAREEEGAEDKGFDLIREVQVKEVGYCGLISHTIPVGGEYAACLQLADEHNLARDSFVVIAKERLTRESPDHYSFLRMLRLVALSARCAKVKSRAWSVFAASVTEAQAAMERLAVLDFDQIVLASSRREGVWEPDTLFRVFGILMRREARDRLYQDPEIQMAFADARRISAIPEEVADALGEEKPSHEALRIQRFETYESNETLNRFCFPLELGDIFETLAGRQYILLTQPCDLMVRKNGKRNYDTKFGRTGAFVELVVVHDETEGTKESWKEVPFYDPDTGASGYVDFAKVHQVQLAVLDLCALREDAVAAIKIDAACPERLSEPWKKRYERLQRLFAAALDRYEELGKKQVEDQLKSLALPVPSATIALAANVSGKTVEYDLKRVMRLRQPWSGVLLSAFAQYQARAAFEHPFDHRLPIEVEAKGDQGPDEKSGTDTRT